MRREHVGAREEAQVVDDLGFARKEAAGRAEGLAEGAHGDLDAALDAEMLGRAATGLAHHGRAVRVIHDEIGAVTVAKLADPIQRRQVAVHRVNPFDGHENLPMRTPLARHGRLKQSLQMRAIVVAKTLCAELGAPPFGAQVRDGQPDAVIEARVIELIIKQHVAFAEQAVDPAQIGLESAREKHRVFAALELGQTTLKLTVNPAHAVEQRRSAHARAEFVDGAFDRILDVRMVGQAEIIV